MVKKITYCLIALVLTACDMDFIGFIAPTSDTTEQRFEQSLTWNAEHGYTSLNVPIDNYKFYVGTDIHTAISVKNITTLVTALRNDSNAYFGILTGDLVNQKGGFHNLMPALTFNPLTQERNDTLFATLGNHDLYFNQWEDYKSYWGTASYWFEVKTPNYQDLFISLDTGNGTLGGKQLKWLRTILESKRTNYRHCIVYTHTNLFKEEESHFPTSNMTLEETFEITELMSTHHVNLFLQGHDHNREVLRYKDVLYIIVDAMLDDSKAPFYMIATCGETIDYKFIAL